MKAHFFYLFIIALSFGGCDVHKHNTQTSKQRGTVKVNCIGHNNQFSSFSGKVADINSNMDLMEATVVIRSKIGTDYYGVRTDSEGNFTIKNVPIGMYDLEVSYFSYEPINYVVEIKQYSNCVAEIKLYSQPIEVEKPIIYLYPTQKQSVHVKLNYSGTFTHTYPKYPENGWQVNAEPNGTLWDTNNQEYYALFWEGKPNRPIQCEDGFVISGKETASFLEEKLAYLGLNRREANEFIMYWLPRMENNPYNFIHFAGKEYEEQAELEINPKPETVIRVMMLTKPLNEELKIPTQDLSSLKKSRKGFTVVEWGGSIISTALNGI